MPTHDLFRSSAGDSHFSALREDILSLRVFDIFLVSEELSFLRESFDRVYVQTLTTTEN